jgi:hypothetical protein
MRIIAKFEGEIADEHRIPAYEGAQSLEGIARTITLVSHFAVTGEVRQRYPFSEVGRPYLETTQQGSFDGVFSVFIDPNTPLVTTAFGTLAVGVVAGITVELLKLITRRVIGGDHLPEESHVTDLLENRSGDIEALADAAEPSIKKAHTVINYGAGNITLINGSNNIVKFNPISKSYVSQTIRDHGRRELLVSVGMLNVNSRYGRVYNRELGRTVPIIVHRDANPRTLPKLAESLQRYSSRSRAALPSDVVIIFETERSVDGVDKRYIVFDAYDIEV